MQSSTKRLIIVLGTAIVLALGLAALVVFADLPPQSGKYVPSELQLLKLQVKQRDAQLSQQALRAAQQSFQAAVNDLMAEAERVRVENKWPSTVQLNPDSLTFEDVQPKLPSPSTTPAPAPATTVPPKKQP